jgi:hypothetical protein
MAKVRYENILKNVFEQTHSESFSSSVSKRRLAKTLDSAKNKRRLANFS